MGPRFEWVPGSSGGRSLSMLAPRWPGCTWLKQLVTDTHVRCDQLTIGASDGPGSRVRVRVRVRVGVRVRVAVRLELGLGFGFGFGLGFGLGFGCGFAGGTHGVVAAGSHAWQAVRIVW